MMHMVEYEFLHDNYGGDATELHSAAIITNINNVKTFL